MNIAPKERILEDYGYFKPNLLVEEGFSLSSPLKCLSVAGHASEGHSSFREKSFADTSALDVLYAISDNDENLVERVRRNVSANIDSAKMLLENLLGIIFGDIEIENSKLYNKEKNGFELKDLRTEGVLFGFGEFSPEKYVIYDPITFLQGAYIASQMDSRIAREETCKYFVKDVTGKRNIGIGGGTCHVANLARLRKRGISPNRFAKKTTKESEIEELIKEDIIFQRKKLYSHKADQYDSNMVNLFVRENIGLGCCDDATLLTIGRLFLNRGPEYALDAFYGAAIIDTIDTIDKMSAMLVTGGADKYIGKYINQKFKNRSGQDLVDKETIYTAIYGGAKNNLGNVTFSSSIRRFHELQRINKKGHLITPFSAHKQFLTTGEKTVGLKLGFEGFPSENFYQIIEDRQKRMEAAGILDKAA